jgi:hypothetical protein
VHPKRVARRMRGLGRTAIDPTPRTRPRDPGAWVSPDVRRGLSSTRVKHVGRTAITSIRRRLGGLSGVAGRAWVSRNVGSGAVSSTRALGCGGGAWERALAAAQPERFPRAQGAPWTSLDCTSGVAAAGMQIRLDERGRAPDTSVVERLWQTVNDEEGDVHHDETPSAAVIRLRPACTCDDPQRRPQALGDHPPAAGSMELIVEAITVALIGIVS